MSVDIVHVVSSSDRSATEMCLSGKESVLLPKRLEFVRVINTRLNTACTVSDEVMTGEFARCLLMS